MSSRTAKPSMHPRLRRIAALVVAVAVLGFSSSAWADDDVRIGYVDLHQALEESERGQEIKNELEQEFQQRQQELDEMQQNVMQQRQQMEQQAMMMSEEQRQEQQMELQQQMEQLQQTYLELQNELAQQEAQATQELFDEMQSVADEIGEERGFTLIIEKTDTSILYSVDGLDLTDELIERFDERQAE